MIVKEWCMFCGECAGLCPRNLIEVHELTLKFNKDSKKSSKYAKFWTLQTFEKRYFFSFAQEYTSVILTLRKCEYIVYGTWYMIWCVKNVVLLYRCTKI